MLNNFYFPKRLIFFIFLFNPFIAKSQVKKLLTSAEIVNIAENNYGVDDRISNGIISTFYTPRADGHPFLLNGNWQSGEIFSNGVKFSKLAIKYNIESDKIFFLSQYNNLTPVTILNNALIDSVKILKHVLINTNKMAIQNPVGYVEVLYKGKIKSYLKHQVSRSTKQTDSYEYFKFQKKHPIIYIIKAGKLIALKSKKDFLTAFSPHEKLLLKFLRQNKIQFKKANREQLIHLLKYCDGLPTL